MLLKTLHHIIAPTVNNYQTENVSNTEMEKSCSRVQNCTKCYSETDLELTYKNLSHNLIYPNVKQAWCKTEFPITLSIQIQVGQIPTRPIVKELQPMGDSMELINSKLL